MSTTDETNELMTRVKSAVIELAKEYTYYHQHLTAKTAKIGRSFALTIQAHKADTARLVGQGAEHIRAMQSLVEMAAENAGIVIMFELIEPEVGEPDRLLRFKDKNHFNADRIGSTVMTWGKLIFVREPTIAVHAGLDKALIEMLVSNREDRNRVERCRGAFKPLLNAIGKAHNKKLYVNVVEVNDNELNGETNERPVQTADDGKTGS